MRPPPVAPPAQDPCPWIVFQPTTSVHAEPLATAAVIGTLAIGQQVSGRLHTNPATDEDWIEIAPGQHVSLTAVHRIHPANRVTGNIPIGTEVINRWWGLPIEYEPNDLVELNSAVVIADGKEYRLRIEAADAVEELVAAAARDGIVLRVVSAYRSGPYQRELYNRNVEKHGRAQRASAPPGHSEHQLGTTVDFTDLTMAHAFEHSFGDTPEGCWLTANAPARGFHRTYRDDNTAQTGYISEPWHWRFLGTD
jgi:D-alanyl-D-alanine carboxypeptidase